MIFKKTDRASRTSAFGLDRSADAESARRATRARDHLERKRAKERKRRERETRREDASWQRVLFQRLMGPVALTGSFAVGLFATPSFVDSVLLRSVPLERIEVEGTRILAPQTLAAVAGLARGTSLAGVDPAAISERLERNPWIEAARALRLPDGGMVLSIVERSVVARRVFAATETPSSDAAGFPAPPTGDTPPPAILVDQQGESFADQRFEEARDLALPRVRGLAPESTLPREALEILAALSRQPGLIERPSDVTLVLPTEGEADAGYVLEIGEDGPRALLGQTLLRERIARLASVLESVHAEASDADWIDLRYADRAVLQTEPASG